MLPPNLLPLLTTLALSTTLTSSTPTPDPLSPREPQISTPFYLQTRVLQGDPTKNNLFAVAYHAYAGGNDVALLPNSSTSPSSKAFLNGTYVQFDLGQGDAYPWGLVLNTLDGGNYWDIWNAVGINTAYGDGGNDGVTNGFFLNSTGLFANYNDFGGWLACDWARGVPQLFSYDSYVTDFSILPSSCAVVNLCQVSV